MYLNLSWLVCYFEKCFPIIYLCSLLMYAYLSWTNNTIYHWNFSHLNSSLKTFDLIKYYNCTFLPFCSSVQTEIFAQDTFIYNMQLLPFALWQSLIWVYLGRGDCTGGHDVVQWLGIEPQRKKNSWFCHLI